MTNNNEQNKKQNIDINVGMSSDYIQETETKNGIKDNTKVNTTRVYNIQNLKKYGEDIEPLSHEEAKNRGRKGGIKSGEVRKARKTMKETILAMLSQEITPEQMEQYGLDKAMLNGDNTMQGAIIASMLREALNGSEKAALLLRDTMGEAPVNRSEVVQEVITKDDSAMMDNLKQALIG